MLHLLLTLAPQVPGGFDAGDLVVRDLENKRFQLVDPLDGTATDLVYPLEVFEGLEDSFAYEPARDRLVFLARLTPSTARSLYFGTAAGTLELVNAWSSFGPDGALAPDGKGRVYFRRNTRVEYVDPTGAIQTVGDGAGNPFDSGFSGSASHMEYDPGSNSLVFVASFSSVACASGTGDVHVTRWELSEDGTQIVGESCIQFDVGTFLGGNGSPRGLTLIEPGKLLLLASGNNQGAPASWTLKLVEPEGGPGGTLAISDWATPDFPFSSDAEGVAYSYVRDQAVVANQAADALYAYDEGGSSPNIIFSSTGHLGVDGLVDIRSAGTKGMFASGASAISVGAGGQQDLEIDFGVESAGDIYAILGSVSGFTAFEFAGVSIPLVIDGYTTFTLTAIGSAPLAGGFGLLDGSGRASASFAVPPGTDPALAGVNAHHSTVVLDPATGGLLKASAAVTVTLVP